MMRAQRVRAALLGVFLAPLTAHGQSAAAPPPPTATFSSSVTETIDVVAHSAATAHIGRNDLDARHARTLDEALTFVPGIRVRADGNGRPVINVRGFRPRHVLLLLDGVPLNGTSDGQFDAALIPTEFLQDVSLTFGAGSVLYGDGALGGVIELSPATATATHGGGVIDWRGGNQRSVAGHIATATPRVSAMLSARSFAADGFPVPGRGGLRANSDSEQNAALAKVSLALTRRWRVGGLVTLSGGSYGVPPSRVDGTSDPFAQRTRYERVEDFRTNAAQVSWDYKGDGRFSARGWAFRNDGRQHRARYDEPSYNSMADETVAGTFDTRDGSTVSGGAVHGRYNLGRLGLLKASLNARREQFASAGVIRDVRRGAGRFDVRPVASDEAFAVTSGGVEWEGRPRPGIGLVAGYAANVQTGARTPTRTGPTLLAGFFKEWQAGLTLHAAAFRRLRFPSIADLYEAGAGNPDLRPEQARGVEAGVDRRVGQARVSVNGYLTFARDFIQRSDDLTHYVNRDRYRLTGVDTAVQLPVASRGLVRAMYSFLDAVDRSAGAARSRLQYQPRHRISLDNRWAVTRSTLARAEVAWTGREAYYARTLPVTGRTLRPYTLLDLDVTRSFADNRAALTAGLTNALDAHHESPYGMPQPGRTLHVSLTFRVGR